MTDQPRAATAPRSAGTDLTLSLGLLAVILFFVASGAISYFNTRTVNRGTAQVTHTHEVLSCLDDVVSLAKDAETGQRGFIITGDEAYLQPYRAAVQRLAERLTDVGRLTSDNPEQQNRLQSLQTQVDLKLKELTETITLRRAPDGFERARTVVMTDRGKVAMDAIRSQVAAMEDAEQQLRVSRIAAVDEAYRVAVGSGILTGVLGAALATAVAVLMRRAMSTRQRLAWLQNGELGLGTALAGGPRLDKLGGAVLKFLAEYLDAHAGVFYAKGADGFRRVASYGLPATARAPESFEAGDGLLGQAVQDNRTFVLSDVPDGYIEVGTGLARGTPRHLVVSPFATDGGVNAVLELGFIHPPSEVASDLLCKVSEAVAIEVRSANYRDHLQKLLEETQRQSEELQAQGEELRVANEELEEQSRALKESQVRLEQQQAELEQTNAQLEEQTQLLETQKEDVLRSQAALQVQARELEQASRYKSDFLANMSHELRTPLNSSLILAKLLSDNAGGNLSPEEVKYAQTIHAAGNDLLTLINDILDLSKIEAGHMEVRPETVRLSQLSDDLTRVFQPVAVQKELKFQVRVALGCPETIGTDRQRLEQVLKNLLSNALKFTEKGEVELLVRGTEGGRIAFAVRDTGIGIAMDQQQVVFEAFRQADGTTNRKYGGTGLGLSISRELTRLLGGTLTLESEVGRGSTFTVTLPAVYDPALVPTRSEAVRAPAEFAPGRATPVVPASPAPPPVHARGAGDDRERLSGDRRAILVVEDDEAFARIVYDLAHELGFQCLIAATAEEALAVAAQHRPSAVILDVGLPDNSGLSVLDRLKRDSRTRHVPVHVVSAGDYAETALALGAIGYMLKPVKREHLVDALQRLETKLDQRLRRVLIVEDDAVQLDSLRKLLGSRDVETVGVGTAAECLKRLKDETFDCMVLDLSLPDASGYSLLETLSREDAYAFPPVIVYTGRDLSADQEQRLRRYSKSIIIKGAKSPERLLDEVTLFLHQVVSDLGPEQQKLLERAKSRDAALEGRRILIAEDDVRNVFALTSILEPRGAIVQIARNGREAVEALERAQDGSAPRIDLVLMDVMMPEMDGITATREIRKRPEWKRLPVITLTAKAMKDDQEQCLAAGANDYMAKPIDVEKLLSLVRVWMPR